MENLIINKDYKGIFELISNLDKIDKNIKIEDCSGMYFLYKENVIVYIGISKNIYNRLFEHKRIKEFDKYSFVTLDFGNRYLETLEHFLISLFRPLYNRTKIDFNHYEYLNLNYKNKKEEYDNAFQIKKDKRYAEMLKCL